MLVVSYLSNLFVFLVTALKNPGITSMKEDSKANNLGIG